MQEKKPVGLIISIVAVFALLHMLGLYFRLYWRVNYFDKVLHLLGGFWVAIVVLILTRALWREKENILSVVLAGLAITFTIGLVWEMFELGIGFTSITDVGFRVDTLGDLLGDVAGAIFGSVYIFKYYLK